jgi:glucan phosphorylase
MMKETIKRTGPHFCARRMAKEYTDKFYRKALDAAMESLHRGVKKDPFSRI